MHYFTTNAFPERPPLISCCEGPVTLSERAPRFGPGNITMRALDG